MSDMLRITGMATGLDVDSIVKNLMTAENMKVDKVKQDKQVLQWTQDAYRDIIGKVNTFKSTYFDYTKPESNVLSSNTYAAFDVNSSNSSNVTATAGISAVAGTYSVTVEQLASSATKTGSSINSQVEVSNIASWAGKSLTFTIGGISQTINISPDDSNMEQLVNDVNRQITSNSVLNGYLSASYTVDSSDRKFLRFNSLTGSSIQITGTTINDANSDGFKSIGDLVGSSVVSSSAYTKLTSLGVTSADWKMNLTYNGTNINVDIDNSNGDKTINDVITAINSQTSGKVTAKYDEISGNFVIQTSNTGSGALLKLNSSSSGGASDSLLLNALGLSVDANPNQGQDARVKITSPGGTAATITQPKNNFSLNGINYNLISKSEDNVAVITVTSNPKNTFDKIKSFIDKYNELISTINTQITQKKQYDYKPLTDEQKKSMKETEITAWEAKAKEGLLKGDSNLGDILFSMRSAFYDAVKGAGISLSQVGLSTSSDYSQNGKIIIDEAKLKDAIQNNGTQVANLFMKSSSTPYNPNGNSAARYNEEGIFQRINDIMQDYTRTIRDSNGHKGTLIEKAGMQGDLSEFKNTLSEDMKDKDDMIYELTQKLINKENRYYLQFSQLETAMQQMNSQQSWLTQQLSAMGGGSK